MPTIVIVSPKGGAGKTTSALVIATQIALKTSVTLLDGDPNKPLEKWAKGGNAPAHMTIISDVDEENIIERIEEAAKSTAFVIVDLEGTASKIVVLAVSQADFVIVPTQGSHLDGEQAGRAFRVIEQQEKMMRRMNPTYSLPFAVLLTRTNSAIRTRTLTHIQNGLREKHIPIFKTELNDREAFRAMFSFRQTLENLDPNEVANVDKAIANAKALTQELVNEIRANQNRKQAVLQEN